ncbi:SUN domain-containing protein 1-like [Hyposmocoma kahamanoa]|uniref:SUN domain-containing protein 1-like n=1 Tax=Hyposmocoma kahamanoa TaxID=1477025 RepID=UPI000E6D6942|nr:SUN domain-containing protein 1-like [Hyposmocoma kahamanoa]
MNYDDGSPYTRHVFHSFVCTTLVVLLSFQIYDYFWQPDALDTDVSDVKYVVMQLTRGLSEVNRKHELLRSEIDRMAAVLPSAAAAAASVLPSAAAAEAASKSTAEAAVQSTCNYGVQDAAGDYDRKIVDFALESAGGRVIDTGNTIEHIIHESSVGYLLHLLASLACRGYECYSARVVIRPGALPGECWAFKGNQGEVTIRLLGTVYVSGVSLEHIPPHMSPTKEISSAPRLFLLEGLEKRGGTTSHDFGSFQYDKDGPPIQFFEVQHPAAKPYNMVRLRVMGNWGHSVYTCVYRVRVHGELHHSLAPSGVMEEDAMRIENE